MRRFIYLDSDSLNSYLAQIEKGLQTNEMREHQDEASSSKTINESSTIVGDIGAKIFGIGANIKGEITDNFSETEATNEFIKKIEEKALHDYIFDKVFNYITSNKLIKNSDLKIGDFIFANEKATFFDTDYFLSIFSDIGAFKYSIEQSKKLLAIKKKLHQGKSNSRDMAVLKEEENALRESEESRKDTLKILNLMKITLPYNRFVMMRNYLVTLDDSCFRDNPEIVAFKYGGGISVVGYVTNIIKKDEIELYDNSFAITYKEVNNLMFTLYNNQETIHIIHPLAIFY